MGTVLSVPWASIYLCQQYTSRQLSFRRLFAALVYMALLDCWPSGRTDEGITGAVVGAFATGILKHVLSPWNQSRSSSFSLPSIT